MEQYVMMLENDSDDRYFTKSTLKDLDLEVDIRFDSFSDTLVEKTDIKPSLILLAYNTFPDNGIAMLREFKTHPQWSHIPVIILTEQMPPDHINAYYRAGANSVIKKPYSLEMTKDKIQTFFHYWLNVAEVGQ
jgi:CheY-like chemotaxis protein